MARVVNNRERIQRALRRATDNAVGLAASLLAAEIKLSMPTALAGDVLGVAVKDQPPSAPGTPPAGKSGRLRASITTAYVRQGVRIVGTNVQYARVHELGGTVAVRAHQRTVKVRTMTKRGKPSKRKKRVVVQVSAHTKTYPQRPYMLPAYRKNRDRLKQVIERRADQLFRREIGSLS